MENLTSEQVEIIKDQIGESVSYGSMYPNVARTLVEILEAAINYTHCCTELKDKKALTFEGWLKDNDKQYIYDDFIEGSFTYSMGSWYREYLKDVK